MKRLRRTTALLLAAAFLAAGATHATPNPPAPYAKAIWRAHLTYGVPYGQAVAVADCESIHFTDFYYGPGLYPPAHPTKAQAFSATGLFQFQLPTWKGTPYARFPRTNIRANALAAGWLWRHDGRSWREWQCKP